MESLGDKEKHQLLWPFVTAQWKIETIAKPTLLCLFILLQLVTLVFIWTNHSFLFLSGTNIHGKHSSDKGNTFKKHAWQLAHGFSLASGQYLALTKFSPVMETQHQPLCQGKVSTCRQTSTDSLCIICEYVIPFFFFCIFPLSSFV